MPRGQANNFTRPPANRQPLFPGFPISDKKKRRLFSRTVGDGVLRSLFSVFRFVRSTGIEKPSLNFTVSFREGKYHTTHTETQKKTAGGKNNKGLIEKKGWGLHNPLYLPPCFWRPRFGYGATVFLEKSIIQTDCQPL